jgi:predicted nucleic acid-binding protein
MRLLVDTNLFIEVLLNQASAADARTFLENRKGHELYVSDSALHSISLLAKARPPRARSVRIGQGLSDSFVLSLSEDQEGALWVASQPQLAEREQAPVLCGLYTGQSSLPFVRLCRAPVLQGQARP